MKKTLLLLFFAVSAIGAVYAQGVTTASMSGRITDSAGGGLPGANIVATHVPSGTTYGTISLADGKFTIPAMRIGGPYTVKVSFVGYQERTFNDITLSLGTATNLNVQLSEQATELETLVVTSSKNDIFSSDRTGASTNLTKEVLSSMPTHSRSINDFTRLTPQASGRSFVGTDARFNNITVDGSSLNNSFGLADQPGGRTGSTPISLDAIEEVQVNIAPYDVRQAGFIGAGVNAVTRSGTNEYSGSVFYNFRNESLVGDKANGKDVVSTDFNVKQYGFRLGGPIIKNKLFFFINGEAERRSDPATPYTANDGTETAGGTKTRVLRSDLDQLSQFLATNYGYETGPYEGYNNETTSDKFLVKFDYNINDKHKLSLRYNWLNSERDVLASNSSSLGFGSRNLNTNALNYQNSNYIQTESIQSVVAELNSRFSNEISNSLIVSYTYQNEDRASRGDFFPLVEIQDNATTYITFGFEPFTPNNKLNYKTFQIQDNLTLYRGNHTWTAGFNLERLSYENVFFPGSQSVYVYSDLQDFYNDTDANPANNPTLRRFQLRYVNPNLIAPGEDPVQPTQVTYTGAYIQDEISPLANLKLTAGLRFDIPIFAETGFYNSAVEAQTYRAQDGSPYTINTAKLPDSKILFSPRLGFNYDVKGDRSTQVRGGTGIFTGRPVFVWISNQIGNNGVLTGFDQIDNTTTRTFNPDPLAYVPATANLPSSYEIAATDPEFKFPQIWRSNLAVDQKLPANIIATLEFIYSKDINGIGYFNANLPAPSTSFTGPDNRPRYTSTRINSSTVNAIILNNSSVGSSQSISLKLERPFAKGFTALAAYNFGASKNSIDPGSIASGSYNNNPIAIDPNNPEAAFSSNDQRHRFIAATTYRKEWGSFGGTQVSLFWEGRNQGRMSYIYSTDANGDGNFNDLIYVPADASEMNFQDYDPDGAGAAPVYTAAQQAADWEAYISQDEYLSSRRGQYTERNGAILPWVFRADFNFVQDFYINVGGKRNIIQLRVDFLNVGNLLNDKWGVGWAVNNNRPVRHQGVDGTGRQIHRLNTLGVASGVITPITESYRTDASLNDVWQAQFGIRYIFN